MKIPKELVLFSEIYKIKKVTQAEMNLLDTDKDTEGMLIPKERLIILVNNKNIEDTLWHELGHYFLQTFGYADNEQGAQVFSEFIRSIINQTK